MKIVVVDYQLGNINSIINMLKKIGVNAIHSCAITDIEQADKLILPGVGAFDHGMENLQQSGLLPILHKEVIEKRKPILGICLGMQLLFNESEEGRLKGLGWLSGKCIRFRAEQAIAKLRIPHMGWNNVNFKNDFFSKEDLDPDTRYYFVHSYHALCQHPENILGTTTHGYEFPAIVGHENILGAQFHPEKSHKYGMQFLKYFVESSLC
jgi:glutamine amidotransferase